MLKKISPPLRLSIFFFILFGLLTKTWVSSWGDASRMATVQSLVDHHTFIIDQSLFFDLTGDKYFYDNHFYSDKSVFLSIYGAIFYFALNMLGLSFETHGRIVYPLVTLLAIGGLACLSLVFQYRILRNIFGASREWAEFITFLTGAGTLLLPYALVFNNHAASGALLLMGFYCVLKTRTNTNQAIYPVSAGVLFALAGSTDINSFLFIPIFAVLLIRQSLRAALLFIFACLPVIGIYLSLNLLTSGSVIPPALNAPLWDYPGSAFNQETMTGLENHNNVLDLLVYSFHMLLGNRGLFSHTPILFFTVVSLWSLLRPKSVFLYQREMVFLMLAIALNIMIYILKSTSYSADAFGVRWFAPLMLILMLPLFALEKQFLSRTRFRFMFIVVAAISCLFALIGSFSPYAPGFYLANGQVHVANTIISSLNLLIFESSLAGKLRIMLAVLLVYFYFYKLLQKLLRYQLLPVESSRSEIN